MSMSEPEHSVPENRWIAELVNEYFDRRQAGEDVSPERFAAEHSGLAEQLTPYLQGLALIDQVRSTLEVGSSAGDLPGDAALPVIPGYVLRAEIGRGGMGVVYRALQVTTKRTVAIKVMLAAPFASETARRRFAREVELAARLDHPNIVRVLESGSVAGQPYYAMDFVAGTRLDQFLAGAKLDVSEVLQLFAQIAAAVHSAHERGVVHRDLKPGNVLVDDARRPHILDFGLAKAVDQAESSTASGATLSSPGQVLGTLGYLSPEQAAGRVADIDARTDVYAIGVMLFEALTGRSPIDLSGRPSDVIQRILEVPPISPARLSRRVDAELETIVLKTLAKEPAQRYAAACELADDLNRYLGGEPILARRPSSLYIVRKKFIKHRGRIGVAGVCLGLALLAIWAGVSWTDRQRAQRAAAELDSVRHEALQVQQHLDIGDVRTARSSAQAIVARHPELPEGHLILAQALLRTRDDDQAIVNLQRALLDESNAWAARALLSEVYRSGPDAERAERLAAEAERGMPDTADAWYLRSFATLQPSDAAGHARQAVQRDPGHVLAWVRLAQLGVCLNDLEGGEQAARRLCALEPGVVRWQRLLADMLVRRHEFEQAVRVYTEVIEKSAGRETPYEGRAVAFRRLKRYTEAIADYDRLLASYTRSPDAGPVWHSYQRATPLWMCGRGAEAADDYRRVRGVVGRPHYADARLAIVLHSLGQLAEADDVLQAALRQTDDPWLERVFACLRGDLSPEELAESAQHDPKRRCEACYYAGEAGLWRGDFEAARRWFERCLETGVEFDPHTFYLAPMNEYELAQWRLESSGAASRPAGG